MEPDLNKEALLQTLDSTSVLSCLSLMFRFPLPTAKKGSVNTVGRLDGGVDGCMDGWVDG